MVQRVLNLPEWGRHVTEAMRNRLRASPDPEQEESLGELESYLPRTSPGPDYLGFAVPLRLRGEVGDVGELSLITTLTAFATATDVSLAELHLEAVLPADAATARYLSDRGYRTTHDLNGGVSRAGPV